MSLPTQDLFPEVTFNSVSLVPSLWNSVSVLFFVTQRGTEVSQRVTEKTKNFNVPDRKR